MKTLSQVNQKRVSTFLNSLSTEVCISDYINTDDLDVEEFEDDFFSRLTELIEDNNGFEQEVIYYSVAIDYLRDNDPSLKESLEIAVEYGYEIKNLSSEVLASLLKTQNVREDFNELETEINTFFSELYEELEETEE